jgi:hypothetical protein
MKLRLLIIILSVALCGTISAQSEFMNGYIIKKDGSYTYGQLKFISKGFTAKECVFRWFDISAEYIFLPGDISGFGFTHGMRYKAADTGGQKVFVSCLTDGELDLLYDGKTLYLDGLDINMVPVDDGAGSINSAGKMESYNGYRQLVEKLPDPENRFTPPADISLKPERMAEVIAAWNRSQGHAVTVSASRNPSGVYEEMKNLGAYQTSYGVLAGVNASKYSAQKTSYIVTGFVPEMDFFEVVPLVGIWISRPLSRAMDNFSFNAELIAFRTNVYMYDEFTNYAGVTRSDINLSYTGIKVPLSLRISIGESSLKPFLGLGGFGMINLGATYNREGETENSLHVVRPFTDDSMMLHPSMFGALAGLGIKKELNPRQSFSIELRAEYASGIYERQGINQSTLSFNVIAAIDFR